MSAEPVPLTRRAALPLATIGRIRQLLVARVPAEILNPFGRTAEDEQVLRDAIASVLDEPELDLAPTPALIASVEAAVVGLGPLQPLVADPEISDILVNGPETVFVERRGRLESTDVRIGSARELIELSERIAALAGRELSVAHPIVDARMADGSRVNAVIPPVGGPYLSIRKFNRLRLDLLPGGQRGRDWVTEGGLSAEMAGLLIWLVRARANVLVAGETGAGKTTFVRSLTDYFYPQERIGVVEDTAELALDNPNRFSLETSTRTTSPRAKPRTASSTSAISSRMPSGCGPIAWSSARSGCRRKRSTRSKRSIPAMTDRRPPFTRARPKTPSSASNCSLARACMTFRLPTYARTSPASSTW